jgi:hypothetical protein
MELWCRSDIIHAGMESLVKRGLLPVRTEALGWSVPDEEEVPTLSNGYIVSFTLFHEHRLAAPPPIPLGVAASLQD